MYIKLQCNEEGRKRKSSRFRPLPHQGVDEKDSPRHIGRDRHKPTRSKNREPRQIRAQQDPTDSIPNQATSLDQVKAHHLLLNFYVEKKKIPIKRLDSCVEIDNC